MQTQWCHVTSQLCPFWTWLQRQNVGNRHQWAEDRIKTRYVEQSLRQTVDYFKEFMDESEAALHCRTATLVLEMYTFFTTWSEFYNIFIFQHELICGSGFGSNRGISLAIIPKHCILCIFFKWYFNHLNLRGAVTWVLKKKIAKVQNITYITYNIWSPWREKKM